MATPPHLRWFLLDTGSVPVQIGSLRKLARFFLAGNQLEGNQMGMFRVGTLLDNLLAAEVRRPKGGGWGAYVVADILAGLA